jgi:predicted phosphodiesterase
MRRHRVVVVLMATVVATACAPSSSGESIVDSDPSSGTTRATVATTEVTGSTEVPPTSGSLLVVGDWGSGDDAEREVAAAMRSYSLTHKVDAILTTGDNFYSDDSQMLMEPYAWAEEETLPFWVTWGNHDVSSEDRIQTVDRAFASPPRWAVHDWDGLDVVILDSNQIGSIDQGLFFLNAMQSSQRPMIVALHHPPYSCSHHGSTVEVVNRWIGLLDRDVVLVLSGHDHNYQRFEQNGISFVVSGGGGRALYDLNECPPNHPEMLAGAAVHHFVALRHDDDTIVLDAIDADGVVFDSVSIGLP